MSEEFLVQAGEYDFNFVELLLANGDSIDISNQVDAIQVYEDIYSPILTGKLVIRDTLSIPSITVLTGRDLLHFSVNTKPLASAQETTQDYNNPLEGYFHIYKHGDVTNVGDRMKLHTFYFQSLVGMLNTNKVVGKSFSGDPKGIVENIFTANFGEAERSLSTPNYDNYNQITRVSFTSNMWSPMKCITYATKAAMGINNDPFVFYEDKNGFYFRSLNELKSRRPIEKFSDNDFSITFRGESARRDPINDYRKVLDTRIDVVYDYMKSAADGSIRSSMFSYDILRKTTNRSEFRYRTNEFSSNVKPLWVDKTIDTTPVTQFHSVANYNKITDTHSLSLSNVSYIRDGVLCAMNSSKIEIDVFGRLRYNIGQIVEYSSNLSIPISNDADPNALEDKLISGRYMITAICHTFDREKYMATLELSRESKRL